MTRINKWEYFVFATAILFLFANTVKVSGQSKQDPKNNCIHPEFKKLVAGTENVFGVTLKNHSCEDLIVSISGEARLQPFFYKNDTGCNYAIIPAYTETEKGITIYVKSKSGDSLLGSMTFIGPKNSHAPNKTVVVLGRHRDKGTISVNEATRLTNVSLGGKTFFSSEYKHDVIKSYTIAIVPKEGKAYEETTKGDLISENTRQQLKKVKKGDLISISSVYVVNEDRTKTLPRLTVTVK